MNAHGKKSRFYRRKSKDDRWRRVLLVLCIWGWAYCSSSCVIALSESCCRCSNARCDNAVTGRVLFSGPSLSIASGTAQRSNDIRTGRNRYCGILEWRDATPVGAEWVYVTVWFGYGESFSEYLRSQCFAVTALSLGHSSHCNRSCSSRVLVRIILLVPGTCTAIRTKILSTTIANGQLLR